MQVKCILSHERPAGVFYEEGKVYELNQYDKRFFEAVSDEEDTTQKIKVKPKTGGGVKK